MAVNPIKPITASSATATSGSLTITVFGSVDCSNVYQGTMVHLGGFTPVEAVSGTAVDSGTGNSTITLRSVWPEVTTTARLTAFNSIEGLGQAIQRAQDVVANTAAIEALSGSGLIEKTGVTSYAVAPLTAAGKALLDDTSNTAQRTTLGLGTAATKDVTTSANDTTADRLLKVGDFGIGGSTTSSGTDLNAGDYVKSGIQITSAAISTLTNYPTQDSATSSRYLVEFIGLLTGNFIQRVTNRGTGVTYIREGFSSVFGTWKTMYNSGNSINPKDYGLGTNTVTIITDFTLALPSGHYKALLSTATGGPDTGAYQTSVTVENAVDSAGQTFIVKRVSATATVGKMWYGYRNGSTGAITWNELYHSSNSVNPLDFGVGSQGASLPTTDANSAIEGGIYRLTSSNTNTAFSGTATLIVSRSSNVVSQIQTDGSKMWSRRSTDTGATYNAWNEFYQSGNSVNPLDYGIGVGTAGTAPSVSNLDTNKASGLFKSNGGETGAPVSTSIGSVINLKRGTTDAVNQIFMRGNQADGQNQMFIRGGLASAFSPWSEVYHSSNTNFNVFGGTAASTVSSGVARGTTTVYFALPINSTIAPTSLTIASTFEIRDKTGNTTLVSGLTGADIVLARHNKKNANLLVTTSAVLTSGETYLLVCTATASTITVNF